MEFGIHSSFTVQEKLYNLISERAEKLSRLYDRIHGMDVYLRQEDRESEVEIKVKVPQQKELFAKSRTDSFEKSAAEAFDKIKKQLVKKVELMNSHR